MIKNLNKKSVHKKAVEHLKKCGGENDSFILLASKDGAETVESALTGHPRTLVLIICTVFERHETYYKLFKHAIMEYESHRLPDISDFTEET